MSVQDVIVLNKSIWMPVASIQSTMSERSSWAVRGLAENTSTSRVVCSTVRARGAFLTAVSIRKVPSRDETDGAVVAGLREHAGQARLGALGRTGPAGLGDRGKGPAHPARREFLQHQPAEGRQHRGADPGR